MQAAPIIPLSGALHRHRAGCGHLTPGLIACGAGCHLCGAAAVGCHLWGAAAVGCHPWGAVVVGYHPVDAVEGDCHSWDAAEGSCQPWGAAAEGCRHDGSHRGVRLCTLRKQTQQRAVASPRGAARLPHP